MATKLEISKGSFGKEKQDWYVDSTLNAMMELTSQHITHHLLMRALTTRN